MSKSKKKEESWLDSKDYKCAYGCTIYDPSCDACDVEWLEEQDDYNKGI